MAKLISYKTVQTESHHTQLLETLSHIVNACGISFMDADLAGARRF